ncbi:bifunctional methylenetetrahydrofolate dehydrogenase/methenyltetrahydrofolate cyclohydrolase [Candidatus Shapirobacteria bacterium CG10_big_fil_rev_8_21_14_0_10_38_14]|uniref:Bifunctional protein FolD n=1 Tax=Candidatus Shapirobacteria bacterium CG10_big_fil_rev_8_21_14_0_10_38_14 TaxID=1974483 RepID=A0A2M8L4V6_9BACT|nr:MAG: bifunctional methylenetetrahydrofolate dehydrogenase/methenyltetrahydrofolate cyclohydrolase [Candidatus Shapirobacteria bacterium CG10_big_fil_rev_8_21_14_0_10_38_14]
MKLLDGKKLAEKILNNLKKKIKKKKLKLTLAVVLVGENPISEIFINQKKIACEKIGIIFRLFKFPPEIGFLALKKEIEKIVKKPAVSGVVIQLPLPSQILRRKTLEGEPKKFFPEEFLNLIPEEKDIDVLSEKSLGKFYQGVLPILPPTVSGIFRLFKNYQIKVRGKNVVIVGAGRLVGFPLAIQLLREKATVSVLNEFTKDTPFFTKKADILISGVGKPNLIKREMIKRGAVVIDAGTSLWKGKLVGDVDFKSVSKKASYITPVPGGVGPMTVACLIENLTKII